MKLKFFLIAAVIHVLVISVVWVGFSVPLPRNEVMFFYNGSLASGGEIGQESRGPKEGDHQKILWKTREAAFFAPWLQMRDLDKPRK